MWGRVWLGQSESWQREIKLPLMEINPTAGYRTSIDLLSDFAIMKSTLGQEFEEVGSRPQPKSVSPPVKLS